MDLKSNNLNTNLIKCNKFEDKSEESDKRASYVINEFCLNNQVNLKNDLLLEKLLNEKKLSLMRSPQVLEYIAVNIDSKNRNNNTENGIEREQILMDRGQLPVTSLEFNQAMRDFKTMFPQTDEDVIEMVLRSNHGAVDVTIDQLLSMNVDSEKEKLRSQCEINSQNNNEIPPQYSPATPPPSYQQAVPGFSSLINCPNLKSSLSGKVLLKCDQMDNSSNDSLKSKHNWNPPLIGKLPRSFLQIDPFYRPNLTPANIPSLNAGFLHQKMKENKRQRQLSRDLNDEEIAQYLEDERIAILLQNKEFVQELRRNKHFMQTLELDQTKAQAGRSEDENLPDGPVVATPHDDADFRETLKNMGKASRKKFSQLAKLFSGRKRRSFPHLLGGTGHDSGSTPSRDNLLGDDKYVELENESSDHEDNKPSSSSWRDHSQDSNEFAKNSRCLRNEDFKFSAF